MSTVRLKQLSFWTVFALLIIVALTWGVDQILPQQYASNIGMCDQTKHECKVSVSGDGQATLSFANGIRSDVSIPVSITLPEDLADATNAVRLTLSCKDTYLGVSSVRLIQKPTPNEWLGNIRLPAADKNQVTWRVKATLIQRNGNEKEVWFEFNVGSPKKLRVTMND